MVNDPSNADLIRWSEAGDSFFGKWYITISLSEVINSAQYLTMNVLHTKFSANGSNTGISAHSCDS